jgi:hypothetical protein
LVFVGAIAFAVGLYLNAAQAWANVLLVSYFLLGLGLGGIVLVALQYVTGAGWGVALRRVPESLATLVPAAAIGLALVFVAYPSLYPWRVHTEPTTHHVHSPFKEFWLDHTSFLIRGGIYVAVWIILAAALVRNSRRQDHDGDPAYTQRNVRLSAIFLVVFGVTCWLASYDWIMSLEPEWYSTIFGLYNFAGLFLSALAAATLLVLWLRRSGPFRGAVTEKHLLDLGKLLFAFSTFWAYIWFCQYMLIWYVNAPEETTYYVSRFQGAWQPLFYVNVFLNWVVPFCMLLPRAMKRNPKVLANVSAVVLLGRWLDLYLMIMPPVMGRAPVLDVAGLGSLLGGAGVFGLAVFWGLARAPLVPLQDPYLVESHGK